VVSGTPKRLFLVEAEGAFWKIVQVCTWQNKTHLIDEPPDDFSGIIDVQTFGCRWLYGDPPNGRELLGWFAPQDLTLLRPMETLALAACDWFDLEWVVSL
jgi:hypothetical protein